MVKIKGVDMFRPITSHLAGSRCAAGTCDVEAGNDQSTLHVGAYPIGCGGLPALQVYLADVGKERDWGLLNASTAHMKLKIFERDMIVCCFVFFS